MSHVRKTLGEAVRTVVETLEKRTLLSTVTLQAQGGGNVFAATLNNSTNSVDFSVNGTVIQSVTKTQVDRLILVDSGPDSSFEIDAPGVSVALDTADADSVYVTTLKGNVVIDSTQYVAGIDSIYGSGVVLTGSNAHLYANYVSGSGRFDHLGGTLHTSQITIESSGVFNEAGGTISSPGGLNIYNTAGGTFKAGFGGALANVSGSFVNYGHLISDVGNSNTATVGMQFSGVANSFNLVSGTLRFSNGFVANGGLQIDGSGGTLSVPAYQVKNGAVTQSGGTFHVDGEFRVGQTASGTTNAGYSITGGTLEANTLLLADSNVTSSFSQSGGTVVVNAANIGVYSKGVNWSMTGGSLTATSLGVGQFTTSTSTLNFSGGTIAAGSSIFGVDSQVAVNVSQAASFGASGQTRIGAGGGTATFNQTGGAVYFNELHLASAYDSTGVYNLSGGTLTTGSIYLTKAADWSGDTQHATFNQTGGTHTNNWMVVGEAPNGTAQYNLTAGTLAGGWFFMGGGTSPEFIQTAGQASFSQFFVGSGGSTEAKYRLLGGSLFVDWAAAIGYSSAGRFEQSGGSSTFNRGLTVSGNGVDGQNPGGLGAITLSGNGSLTTSTVLIGYGTNGSFQQSGGHLQINDKLIKNGPSGTIGTVTLAGGTRNAYPTIDVLVPTATGNPTVPEGSPYSLGLIATSDIGYNAITSWSVNWDDTASPGSQSIAGSPAGVQHTYYVGGQSHTIQATAFGGGKSYPSAPKSVLVTNAAPVIAPLANITVDAGVAVNLLAAFTEPGTGQTHTAAIEWGDGAVSSTQAGNLTLSESGQSGTVAGTHTFNTNGTYTATVYVTDSLGGVSSRTVTIVVAYVPPTLTVALQPATVNVGDPVTVNLTAAGPEAGGVTAWKVDWGDNTVLTYSGGGVSGANGQWVMSQSHAYAVQGNYTITAWAIDSQPTPRLAGTAQVTVSAAPLTSLAAPSAVTASAMSSTEVKLSWHDNANDEEGFKVYASENGGAFTLLQTLPFPHTGSLPAQTAVTSLTPGSTYAFYVTSYQGSEESNASRAALVQMPTGEDVSLAIIGPSAVTANATVRYKAVGPTDETGDPTYVWAVLLEGKSVKSGQGTDFSYVASEAGDYTVQLTCLKANNPPIIVTRPLTVAAPSQAACVINGPAVSEIDRISVFNVKITKDMYFGPRLSEDPDYVHEDHVFLDWTARDGNGQIVLSRHASLSDVGFMFIPSAIGRYEIDVTITRTDGIVGYEGHLSTTSTQGAPDTFSKQFVDFGQHQELGNQIIEDAQKRFVAIGSQPLYPGVIDKKASTTAYLAPLLGTIHITRLHFDLTVDESFANGGQQTIFLGGLLNGRPIIRELDDGKYLIAVLHYNAVEGISYMKFIKLDEYGQLDESYGDGGIASWKVQPRYIDSLDYPNGKLQSVYDMIVAPDGKIYVAGGSYGQGPFPDDPWTVQMQAVMRFNADGTLDDGSELDSTVGDSFGRNGLAEIPVENSYRSLVSGVPEYATNLLLSPDGSIFVGGTFISAHLGNYNFSQTDWDVSVAKLTQDGALDTSFGSDGRAYVPIDFGDEDAPAKDNSDQSFSLLRDSEGRIIIAGTSGASPFGDYRDSDFPRISIARLMPNGLLDENFYSDASRPGLVTSNFYGSESGWSAAVAPDDKIVVAGASMSGGIISRFNTDGSVDESFGNYGKIILDTGFSSTWQSVIIASDNDIVIAGNASKKDLITNADVDGFGIAKYRPGDVSATDLTATARVDGPIDLNWIDAGTDEDGFLILRSTSPLGPSSTDVVGTVSVNVTSWTDTTVVPGQRYYYRVVAFRTKNGTAQPVGSTGIATAQAAPKNTGYVLAETVAVPVTGATVESALSLLAGENYKLSVHGYFAISKDAYPKMGDAQYGIYRPEPEQYSKIPINVQFGLGVNDEKVDLNHFPFWGEPSTDAAHTYSIMYSPTTTGKLRLNYHDSYYPDNQPGYFMMVDVYRALPGAPETVNADTDRVNKRVKITWNNVAADATRILVQRSVNGSAYATIATLPPNAESYSDPKITFNTKYSYRVITRSIFGDSLPSNEAVAVMVNIPPKIEAIDAMIARVGTEFNFRVDATDVDDPTSAITYELGGYLPVGPWGDVLPLINSNGEVHGWIPTAIQVGNTYVWRITVRDVDGGTAERYAVVKVMPDLATIPAIATQPHVVSQTDTTADVSVLASDDGPESDLKYKWVVQSRPFGVRLPEYSDNGTNSAKNTTIRFFAAGTYKFQVQVSDGTDYYGSAELTITVAPVFSGVQVIEPSVDLSAGDSHPFKAVALDQFGRNWDPNNPVQPTITWAVSGTAGGQIGPVTGVYQAPSTVSMEADDTVTATATSGSVVKTAHGNVHFAGSNQAPVIDTDAAGEFLIDAVPLNFTQLRLTVVAYDPDGPASDLKYTWSVTPAGNPPVTFTENGTNAASTTIANCPENAALNYTFTVTVTDKHGGKASTFIELTDTRKFETVELAPKVSTLGVGKTTTFTATAKDQYDRQLLIQPAFEWKVDGIVVPGQTGRTFEYTAPQDEGQHTVSVSATSEGVTHTASADVIVVGQRPPVLLITSPSASTDPTVPIDIEQDAAVNLVVDDVNDDPVSWYLWLKPTIGNRILVAKGDLEVGSAPTQGALAATLSPTVYADGNYTLQLTATDEPNAAVVDQRLIRIHSNYKIGSLRLPFVDAQIDVANGTPLTATRVYDSMTSGVEGEFGYGWTLEKNVSATDFQITARSGEFTQGSIPAFRTGDLVYLKTPDGQQHVFAFVPEQMNVNNTSGAIGNFLPYKPRFVAVDGTRSELSTASTGTIHGNTGSLVELRMSLETGEWFYSIGTGILGASDGYNPVKPQFGNSYSLKTDDGTVYKYDGSGNLSSATDPNGNVTLYSGSGSAAGRALQIRYDPTHPSRITGISDVPGFTFTANPDATKFVEYTYDAAGDLHSVRDRSLNVTTFEYKYQNGVSTHRLTKIIDSRGVQLVTANYDPDSHLLTAVADSSGKGTNVVTAPLTNGQSAQSSKDAAGNKSEVIYNDHGDVIREIKQLRNAAGNVIGYQVTVNDYGYGESNRAGWDQAQRYGVTNINKRSSEYHYAPFTVDGFDASGLRYTQLPAPETLTSETSYKTITGSDTYPEKNQGLFQPTATSSRGEDGQMHTTWYRMYYAPGKPCIIESPDGQLTWMLYDPKGRLEYTITGYARDGQANGLQEGTKTEYDAKGRVIGTYQVSATGGSGSTLPTLTVGRQLTSSTYYNATSGEGYVDKPASTTNLVTGLTTYYSYYADGQSKAVMRQWQQGGVTHQIRDSLTEYDAAGRAYRVYDSENKFTETHYNELGQVSYTVDKFGGKTAMVYDARGQVIRTVYADGTESRTAYDDLGRAAFTSDRFYSGATISTVGVPSAATATASLVTRTVYDSLGRATDTERYKNTVIAIDTTGVAPAAVTPNASQLLSQGKRVSLTSTTYDSQGRVATTTDAAGTVTKNQYIANGGLQSVTTAYGTGDASTTSYAYHQTNASMPANAIYFDSVTDGKQHTTKTYKDANGRAVRVEYHDGSYVDTVYSPTGVSESAYKIRTPNITTGMVEEALPVIPSGGRETITFDQRKASDPSPPYTINVYDAAGRLADLYLPSPDGIKVSPHWHYDYDANGNLVQQVDPKGHVTSFTYDDSGNRTSRTMPADSDGNTANDTESWQYDAYGRLEWHVDFMGHSTKYVYDNTPAHGDHLSEEQRFVGAIAGTPDEKTVYHYDDLGRQDGVTEYADGNMSGASRTTTFAFDPVTGGTTQVASPEGVLNHAYDPATGRLTRTWTASNDTTYAYDKQGRLGKVIATKVNGLALATPQTTEYTYDAAGNLDLKSSNNGTPATSDDLISDYAYTSLNQLDTLATKQGTALLFDQNYDYTSDGQKDKVTEHRGNVTTAYDWTYDALNRLTDESYTNGGDAAKNYAAHYAFDLAGNRVSKTQTGANAAATISTYNDRNELATTQTNGGPVVVPQYDANGNTLSDGTLTYTWDLRNRMASVTKAGVTTAYAYDENGVRVSKQIGTGPVRTFVNDASNPTGYSKPLEERLGGTLDASYVLGLSVLGQQPAANTQGYLSLVQDGQGKTRSLISLSGVDVQPADYDAYGNALQAGLTATPWQNPDGYTDFESGLTQQLARSLDRDTGRWASEDSIIFDAGGYDNANLFGFASNDPLSKVDPTGHFAEFSFTTIGMISTLSAVSMGILFTATRFSAHGLVPHGQFQPVIASQLGGVYHSIEISGSQMTEDQLFARLSKFSTLNMAPVKATNDITSVGDVVSFDLQSWFMSVGQGQFSVKVTKYDPQNHFIVVRTLSGHPLAGWRAWGTKSLPNGNILVETFSVEAPATPANAFQMNLGGMTAMFKTWNNMLGDILQFSGGIRANGAKDFPAGIPIYNINPYYSAVSN